MTSSNNSPPTPIDEWSTPPADFGPAFAAVVTEALSWSPERCAELRARFDAVDDFGRYDEAGDAVYSALLDADLAEYDCDLDDNEVPAGWVDKVSGQTGIPGAGQVAWAVLARDHDLIGDDDDFATLTGWWTAAGLPMPDQGEGQLLAKKAARVAEMGARFAEVERRILERLAAGETVPGIAR